MRVFRNQKLLSFICLTTINMLNDYFCPMKLKWLLFLALSVECISSCTNTDTTSGSSGDSNSTNTPVISYSIAATYPHDTSSFTEGLEFYKSKLLESTGNKGKSKLLEIDLQTGKPSKNISLEDKYFGEGLTVFNDTLYQLTYQEQVVHAYSAKDFKKIKEFTINGEGWGLTNDGKYLIASNGSSNLYFYEPGTFRLLKTQLITENGSPAVNINELEYINGYVYANQYQYNYIIKIDPNSGQVVGKLDLTDLVNKVKTQAPYINELNGIAYNPETKKFYVTGKYWPQIFELQLAL
jgi:glutaminyl-peptide cyclotransferase